MRITDILDEQLDASITTLKLNCSKFFTESGGLPLFKRLPESYPDFHRVKVRHGKKNDAFSASLDLAFESERTQFSQRAIFATGKLPAITTSSFYIFPTDNFNFLYNTTITEENDEQLHAFDSIYERYGMKEGSKLIAEVLRFSYTPQNLHEGLEKGSEIILYGIPFYYAMRVNSVERYSDVLTSIAEV